MNTIKEYPIHISESNLKKLDKIRKDLKTFLCYIKSGSVAPDFELPVEAKSKSEAIKLLLKLPQLVEYNKESLKDYVMEIKDINYNDYRN